MKISGVKTEVKGLENIPDDTSVLFASNHKSYFRHCYYIINIWNALQVTLTKSWNEKISIIKLDYCTLLTVFFLDRENPRKGLKTIQKGTDYLQNGVSMFICPEGTTFKTNEMLPFKEGSLKMAIKAKKPIVPVGIINSAAIFEEHFQK